MKKRRFCRELANMRPTKELKSFLALAESLPTPATLSTDTNIEIHKYLDHCENEHKEENALGLHGASDQCGTPSLTTH